MRTSRITHGKIFRRTATAQAWSRASWIARGTHTHHHTTTPHTTITTGIHIITRHHTHMYSQARLQVQKAAQSGWIHYVMISQIHGRPRSISK